MRGRLGAAIPALGASRPRHLGSDGRVARRGLRRTVRDGGAVPSRPARLRATAMKTRSPSPRPGPRWRATARVVGSVGWTCRRPSSSPSEITWSRPGASSRWPGRSLARPCIACPATTVCASPSRISSCRRCLRPALRSRAAPHSPSLLGLMGRELAADWNGSLVMWTHGFRGRPGAHRVRAFRLASRAVSAVPNVPPPFGIGIGARKRAPASAILGSPGILKEDPP